MTLFFGLLLLLALGISWVVIYLKGYWYIKAAFITLALYLTLSLFLSVENFKGWATSQELPEEFKIEWVVIQEPDKVSKTPGGIYVWVIDINVEPVCFTTMICLDDPEAAGPRAYKLEYDSESHQQAITVTEMIQAGEEVTGENKGEEPEDGELSMDDIVIHELPQVIDTFKKGR